MKEIHSYTMAAQTIVCGGGCTTQVVADAWLYLLEGGGGTIPPKFLPIKFN